VIFRFTPHDSNWDGAGAVTNTERRLYAQQFVAACRAKSINAVAITDHHDLAFFKYIREAALNETDASGKALPATERLTVFPGLELTLGIPCQALLLSMQISRLNSCLRRFLPWALDTPRTMLQSMRPFKSSTL
jgi:hypothetical protein